MSAKYHIMDPRGTMDLLLRRGAYGNAYDMNSWTALTECGHYGSWNWRSYCWLMEPTLMANRGKMILRQTAILT